MFMSFLFWSAVISVAYTYVGYPVLLYLLVRIRGKSASASLEHTDDHQLPTIALMIAAYNEQVVLEKKVSNTLSLNYPIKKRRVIFITDGSTDSSVDIIRKYPEVELFHQDARRGKNHAINRVVGQVECDILVFCDANTLLNADALLLIARHYRDPQVGGVAGEKRVMNAVSGDTASSGESAYWKYESRLKELDSALFTVVGAAGELFSVRRDLYEPVPADIIIEDFFLSMRIVEKGYRVLYEPRAYAYESASASIAEERKRKIRIAAGGLQAIARLKEIRNIGKFKWASFCYFSHRVFRWTLAPLGLIVMLVTNILLLISTDYPIYRITMMAQIVFYLAAFAGSFLQSQSRWLRALLIPYYFTFMNVCVYKGFLRFVLKSQSAVWERSVRAGESPGS